MRKLPLLAAVAGTLIVAALSGAQQPPHPQPAPKIAPPPVVKPKHHRGARPSPRHRIFSAKKYEIKPKAPASFIPPLPKQISYWGNDTYGDCVTAEEMCKLAVYSLMAGLPEVYIPDANAIQWAGQNGYLNGADLVSVMDTMGSQGITYGGTTYKDGPPSAVDYTTYATVCSAISEGPVKIGIAADQLESVVGDTNGWVLTGASPDSNEDHCISLVGFGTVAQCCQALGVPVPAGVTASSPAYVAFTWATFGVIDHTSMVNITGEAWVRQPSTVGESPAPAPTPTPSNLTYSLGPSPSGAALDAAGNFTWSIPAAQPPGPVAVTFTVAAPGGAALPATATFTVNVVAQPMGQLVIAPIPPQSATPGQTISLGLSQYITTGLAAKP